LGPDAGYVAEFATVEAKRSGTERFQYRTFRAPVGLARFLLSQRLMMRHLSTGLVLGAVSFACGIEPPAPTAAQSAGSEAAVVCVEDPSTLDPEDLRCEASGTFECGVDEVEIFVEPSELDAGACGTSTLTLSDPAPGLGSRIVDVVETSSTGMMSTVCSSTVTVVDTRAPTVVEQMVELWPPNHKLRSFEPEDCAEIADACDEEDDLDFRFVSVTVDEPVNGRGDGNTEPDVVYDCDGLSLRAERAGGGDGRVYRVAFEVEDGGGNVTEGTCFADVPPNQSRPATESAESYTVVLEEPVGCDDDDDGDGDDDDDDDDDGDGDGDGDDDDDDDGDDDGDDDDDDDDHPGRGRPDFGVNTGPLPDGCTKIEGMDIGSNGIMVGFGMNEAIVESWFLKDDGSDYVDFDYTVTSTPAYVSVKAGRDIFVDLAVGTSTQAFRNPNGTMGPAAKGISNVVFCDCEDFECEEDDDDEDDDDEGDSPDDSGDDDGGIDPGDL